MGAQWDEDPAMAPATSTPVAAPAWLNPVQHIPLPRSIDSSRRCVPRDNCCFDLRLDSDCPTTMTVWLGHE
jgi:hypothetical protein